jgi:CheY-like chemotaxis protein
MGKRILVVDDCADIREMLAFVFKKAGAAVEEAHDGAEALLKAQAGGFHAILLDLHMPGMDGNTAAQGIREKLPGELKPVLIALTGEHNREILRSEAAHFDHYLLKPIKPHDLIRQMVQLISAGSMG